MLGKKLIRRLPVALHGSLDTLVEPQEVLPLVVYYKRERNADSNEYPEQKATHCSILLIDKIILESRMIIRLL
jgi:hypothetical protein